MKVEGKTHEIIMMTLGALFLAVGVYFFRMPNNFITGGAGGIAIVLSAMFPAISRGTYLIVINIISIIIGLIFLGKSFSWKTIYCCMIYSVMVLIFEKIYPMNIPFSNQPFLELVFAVILCGIGSGIMFHANASSGGIEVVAMIIKTKTSLSIGNALLYVNLVIALSAAVLFNMETCMFSVLGVLINSLVVDNVIQMLNTSRFLIIVTTYPIDLCSYINCDLDGGATIVNCVGSYTNDSKKMIFVALNPNKAMLLQKNIKTIDNKAFIVTLNTFDIIGRRYK